MEGRGWKQVKYRVFKLTVRNVFGFVTFWPPGSRKRARMYDSGTILKSRMKYTVRLHKNNRKHCLLICYVLFYICYSHVLVDGPVRTICMNFA
jgi:hypothetical protein